jgi:uracil-DNA glycosylase
MARLAGYLPKNAILMAKKSKATATGVSSGEVITGDLKAIQQTLGDCTRCRLCKTRNHIVFGEGNPKAELMFVGEGPGATEDETGRPFVGRGGQLLDKMIEAMGSKRSEVFIANIVKCRPPDNRVPEPDEVAQCIPFLKAQIRAVRPKVIVALGATSAKTLLQTKEPIGNLRGKVLEFEGTKLIATFHPAYLLRNPPAKKDCWEDLKGAIRELGWDKK